MKVSDCVGYSVGFGKDHHLADHQAAGSVRTVLHEVSGILGRRFGHQLQDGLSDFRVHLREQVGLMIALNLVDDPRSSVMREVVDQINRLLLRNLFQQVGGFTGIQER